MISVLIITVFYLQVKPVISTQYQDVKSTLQDLKTGSSNLTSLLQELEETNNFTLDEKGKLLFLLNEISLETTEESFSDYVHWNTTDETAIVNDTDVELEPYCSSESWASFASHFATAHGWIALFVCIFGSITNIINIIVLTRKPMLSPTNVLLTGLAFTDLLVMAEYIPFCIHQYLWTGRTDIEKYTWNWAIFILFHAHFTQVFHTISILLTLTLAVWRYIAIGYPQHNVSLCSMNRAMLAIVIDITVSIIFNIPGFLNISISDTIITQKDVEYTVYIVGFSNLSVTTGLNNINFWVYSVVLKLLPCVILSALSGALIRELLRAGQRRAAIMSKRLDGKAAEAERQAERVTKMLLAILILFLVSEVPQGILGLLSAIPGAGFFLCYRRLGDAMDMLVLFNSAVNFIFYCGMSQQFRSTFISLFKDNIINKCLSCIGNNRNESTTAVENQLNGTIGTQRKTVISMK